MHFFILGEQISEKVRTIKRAQVFNGCLTKPWPRNSVLPLWQDQGEQGQLQVWSRWRPSNYCHLSFVQSLPHFSLLPQQPGIKDFSFDQALDIYTKKLKIWFDRALKDILTQQENPNESSDGPRSRRWGEGLSSLWSGVGVGLEETPPLRIGSYHNPGWPEM